MDFSFIKNELANENYSVKIDLEYYYKKSLFLKDKVYSIILKDNTEKTKFSGLNKKLIPINCFNLLFNIYLKGNSINLFSNWIKRAIQILNIPIIKEKKKLNFNYDKCIQVKNLEGK